MSKTIIAANPGFSGVRKDGVPRYDPIIAWVIGPLLKPKPIGMEGEFEDGVKIVGPDGKVVNK